MFKLRQKKIASLVIKDHCIRYAIVTNNDIDRIQAYGERYLPEGIIHSGKILDFETLAIFLKECVDDWKLKKYAVMMTAPDANVFFRKLTIPSTVEEDDIQSYLLFEIGNTIHLPFDEPLFDYHVLQKTAEGTEIFLFATSQETAQAYLDLLQQCQLEPAAIDISTLSLYRLCHALELVDETKHTLLLEFDVPAYNIAVFHEHVPHYMRHMLLNTGISAFEVKDDYEEGRHLLFVGDEEVVFGEIDDAIVEIERLLSFYKFSIQKGTAEIEKVILAGDHPFLNEIEHKLASELSIPVFSLRNKKLYDENGNEVAAQYMLPLGLALKKVR